MKKKFQVSSFQFQAASAGVLALETSNFKFEAFRSPAGTRQDAPGAFGGCLGSHRAFRRATRAASLINTPLKNGGTFPQCGFQVQGFSFKGMHTKQTPHKLQTSNLKRSTAVPAFLAS